MGKIIAAVFTAVVAPVAVFFATQHLKKEETPAAKEEKVAKPAGKKSSDEKPGGSVSKGATEPSRVVAEGTGPTPEAAIEDAHRNAVRQFLPKVVDAGELSRKGKVIEEQVLKDTDPLVKRSEVVESSRDKNKGRDVHRRVLQVTLDRQALTVRLQTVGIRVEPRD